MNFKKKIAIIRNREDPALAQNHEIQKLWKEHLEELYIQPTATGKGHTARSVSHEPS